MPDRRRVCVYCSSSAAVDPLRERFARPESRAAYAVVTSIAEVFAALDAPSADPLPRKWL